jgi:hypothetical protein
MFQVNFAYSDQSLYFTENTFRVYKNNTNKDSIFVEQVLVFNLGYSLNLS